MAQAGVKGVSIGANGRVFPVNVPPAFTWRHPVTGDEVVGLYHAYGYGGIGDKYAIDTVVVPGLEEVGPRHLRRHRHRLACPFPPAISVSACLPTDAAQGCLGRFSSCV